MIGTNLLQETFAWMDTVDLALCLFIYEVCNDCQFEYVSGSDFVNFMNLKPTGRAVTVRPKENLRVCYMVFSVSQTIRPRERGKVWAEEFLKRAAYPSHTTTNTVATFAAMPQQKRTWNTVNPLTKPSKTQGG